MPLVVCKQCGAEVSDEFSYCQYCKTPINGRPSKLETGTRKEFCSNCGAKASHSQRFCINCGQALTIDVVEVLNSSFKILRKAPLIVVPTIINGLFSTLSVLWIGVPFIERSASGASPSVLLATLWTALPKFLVVFVVGLFLLQIVTGMYPSLVEDAYNGRTLGMARALRKAVRQFPSVFASNILVGGLIMLGLLLFLVPGLIVTTWYFYTVPAIILEDRPALNGMLASKKFARNKKWSTFIMLLIVSGISILGSSLRTGTSISNTTGLAVFLGTELVFGVITGVLAAIMPSYTYLNYAMRQPTE